MAGVTERDEAARVDADASASDGGPMWQPLRRAAAAEVLAWPLASESPSSPASAGRARSGGANGLKASDRPNPAKGANAAPHTGDLFVARGVNGATVVHAGVAALLFAALFGASIAVERASAGRALAWFVAGAAVYLLSLRCASNGDRWRRTAFVLVATGATLAAYVALQYRHLGYAEKLALAHNAGWLTSALLPALPLPAFPAIAATGGGTPWQPFANSVATFLEGLLPLALGLALSRRVTRNARLFAAALLSLIAFATFLTVSRGAWIAIAVSLVLWFVLSRARANSPRTRRVIVAAITIGLVSASGWAAIVRPDRLDVYRHTLSLVRDFPFTGIGLGDQFAMVLSQHALLIQMPFLTYSHNLLLDLWIELGLPGALAWVTLVAIVLTVGVAGERAELGSGFRGAWLGLLAIVIHGLSDARQSVDAWTWLPFFALLGLLSARLRRVRVTIPRSAIVATLAAPATLLIAVVIAAWPPAAAWHTNLGGLDEIQARSLPEASTARAEAVESARAHYLDALREDASQPTAHRRLGIMAMADSRYTDALAHLEAAQAADPANWTTRKALGLACVWTGDIDSASTLFESLRDPELPGELNAWSFWRESRGELSLAQHAAQVSARLRPNPAIFQRIASLERMR